MDILDMVTGAFFVIVGVVLAFILIREYLCWYWKINENLVLQRESIEIQKNILNELKITNSNKEVNK